MAFLTSAPTGQAATLRPNATQSSRPNIKAAQNLAKQKGLERKARKYKLPLQELAIFTQQLSSRVSKRCKTKRKTLSSAW